MKSAVHPRCIGISSADKARLRLLLLAKHACGVGTPDAVDGNHAVYHHELRSTLEGIGLKLSTADNYTALFERPDADFVITLLNRGGFQNSEMLAPLLLARHRLPYLGATPIVRGLSDDKHLTKLVAAANGVPTMAWQSWRRGALAAPPRLQADRLVVKPNASSASWGVRVVDDWRDARAHAEALFEQGHDVIIEQWAPLLDVAVPVIGGRGGMPWILPPMMYVPADPHRQRSYEEKRGLVEDADDPLVPVEDPALTERLESFTRRMLRELWPFDYGRFEFRYDPATDGLLFMEVNLSCNLWSRKTISRSAALLGIDHASLVETIVGHSLARQGLIDAARIEIGGMSKATALVLAGKRDGTLDPLAAAADVSHKCLVPVAGRPMILYVLEALAASPGIGEIRVSIDDPEVITALAARYGLADRLVIMPARLNLVDSIVAAAEDASFPLLITTADNVLLTAPAVAEFIGGAGTADAAVAFTTREAVLDAHPDGQRKFYRFAEASYSNCNTYWLAGRAALAVAETFRSGGQFAKHPLRIVGAFGIVNLIRFRYGIGTLAAAFSRFSRRFGLAIRPVILSDGAVAIDVDNPRTRDVAEQILANRFGIAAAAE